MKIITEEERNAETEAVLRGGAKGLVIGTLCSLGLFAAAKFRYKKILNLSTSGKCAIFITPPIFFVTVEAEKANTLFDQSMYSHEEQTRLKIENDQKWTNMTRNERVKITLNENKYKIITGLWALSLWGSWKWADRDKLLSKAQKFYNARMYAQFITIALLLGSIGLSMRDEQKNKKRTSRDDYFNRVIKVTKSESEGTA